VDIGGGVYIAKHDLSGWWGPFSGGGADLSAFRLASIGDDGTTRTNETARDEFENGAAIGDAGDWGAVGSAVVHPNGSSAAITAYAAGKAISRTVAFASAFETAILMSGHTDNVGLTAIALLDHASGNGVAPAPYTDGSAYAWAIASRVASGSHAESTPGGPLTDWLDGRPKWLVLRKTIVTPGVTAHYRLLAADAWSDTLADWAVVLDSDSTTMPGLVTEIAFGRWFSAAAGPNATLSVHAWVHAEPDFGFA
jgi:hypothetical protein